jgi:hypothetical protein
LQLPLALQKLPHFGRAGSARVEILQSSVETISSGSLELELLRSGLKRVNRQRLAIDVEQVASPLALLHLRRHDKDAGTPGDRGLLTEGRRQKRRGIASPQHAHGNHA